MIGDTTKAEETRQVQAARDTRDIWLVVLCSEMFLNTQTKLTLIIGWVVGVF